MRSAISPEQYRREEMTNDVNDNSKNTLTRRKLLAGAAAGLAAQTLTVSRATAKESPTVLITGANRGIGLELARNYAQQDWQVYATARRPEAADDLKAIAARHPKLSIEQLDVLDHEMIDALAKKLGGQPIDVLLNNAAVLGEPNDQKFGARDYELMHRILATNVTGPMKMAEAFIEHVARSEQKKIVAITSGQGSISTLRSSSIVFYNMSKAALNMGMRSNSFELKPRGITVALISPGAVDTAMMQLALNRAGVNFPLLSAADSAAMVIDVISKYGLDRTGTFLSHKGEEIPW
jgi:NAD(P)-dependent dehydrogenase (short-subunit alcohol dehydrogenase family)